MRNGGNGSHFSIGAQPNTTHGGDFQEKKQLSPQRKNKTSYLLGSLHAIAAARWIVLGFCVRRKALAAVDRLFSGVPVRFGGART